jgi:hypothetical protein
MFKSSGDSSNYEGYSTKVLLNWQIVKMWDYVSYLQALGDIAGVVRGVRQMHYSLASLWDGEYLTRKQEIDFIVSQWLNNTPSAQYDDVEANEYEASMRVWAEQIKLLSRANMLPQKDMETVIDMPEPEQNVESS